MKNNNAIVLLGTLLKSTSSYNTLKYTKDKKKKNKIIGGYVGMFFIYLMLVVFFVMASVGYGITGMAEGIPVMTVLTVSAMSLLFTLLRTNGYLYNFKEFDMLLAMPIETKTVVACKFLYMYIKSFPIYGLLSLSMMIGYGIFAKPSFIVYLIWIVLTLIIPLIPMVIASALGVLVARVGSGFRFKKIIQAVFTFIFIFICMFSRVIIEYLARNSSTDEIVGAVAGEMDIIKQYYFPAIWFEKAIVDRNFMQFIAFVVVSIGIFVLFFIAVSKSYIKVNSRLGAHAKSKKKKALIYKKKSVAKTIAYKELKRFFGSVPYLTNAGFGIIFVVIFSIVALFINGDVYVSKLAIESSFFRKDMVIAAVPFALFFFYGMASTTAMTPSLEGKNYWILQSMPVDKKDVYLGKMLFNLYLMLPCAVLGAIGFGICLRADIISIILMLACGLAMSLYSTTWGMVCGLKFLKLDWENDIEIVKQSTAVTVYLLPNMFITMIIAGGAIGLGFVIGGKLYLLIVTVIYLVVSAICYSIVMKHGSKKH